MYLTGKILTARLICFFDIFHVNEQYPFSPTSKCHELLDSVRLTLLNNTLFYLQNSPILYAH